MRNGKGNWDGCSVPCDNCGAIVKESRLPYHQQMPECIAVYWRKKSFADGLWPAGLYEHTLGKAGVVRYRQSQFYQWAGFNRVRLSVNGISEEVTEQVIKLQPWAPKWAYEIAKNRKGKLAPADVRVRLIKSAALSEFSRELILADTQAAAEMTKEQELMEYRKKE